MEWPLTLKPRGVCKFYETPWGCSTEKDCKFLHGEVSLTPYDKNKVCRYYWVGPFPLIVLWLVSDTGYWQMRCMQGIANMEISVGFYMLTDPKSLACPAPTPSVSSATINWSLMASWVHPKSSPAWVSSLTTTYQMGVVMYFASRCTSPLWTSNVLYSLWYLASTSATQYIWQWCHPDNRTNDVETTNISYLYCRVPS